MYSKHNSDRARIIIETLLLDTEISNVMKKIKDMSQVTFEHCLNVAFLAAQVLLHMDPLDLTEREIMLIAEGALLHDIGKLSIPRYLIDKKGYLTDEEFAEIKKHPECGLFQLNRNFKRKKNKIIRNIVKMHHERVDGTGYPTGLRENDIPWYVQLISTIDAYEAMTAVRSYGKSYTREEAVGCLENEKFPSRYIYHIAKSDIN